MIVRHNFFTLYVTLIFCILIIIISRTSLKSQDLKFHHITSDEGYGFGNTWAIMEDSEGFMWFATEDGLIKYDGYNFTIYRNDKLDSSSISSNFSMVLLEDRYNQVWIGTFGGGLNLYDRKTDTFRSFMYDSEHSFSLPHNRVKTLLESQDGNIWIGTEGAGVVLLDPNPEKLQDVKFKPFVHPQINTKDPNILMIRDIEEDIAGNIYIASLSGVIITDKSRKNVTHLQKGNNYPNVLSSNSILSIHIDSKERVWLGTLDEGLDLYLPVEKRVVRYKPSKETNSLNHYEVGTITEDNTGNIWLGTDDGLSKIDDSSDLIPANRFTNYFYEPLNENSLLSNSVKIVYVDSKNSLWAGTYYGGINVYNPNLYKFTSIRNKPWLSTSLSHNNVTSFAEDDHGNLWIGTDGGGVNLLKNAKNNIYGDDFIDINIRRSINQKPETKVKTMKFDHDGNLWIGFWVGGLYSYNLRTNKMSYFGPNDITNSGLEGIRILDLDVDQNNNMWVATFDQGIGFFNRSTGKFKNYLPTEKSNVGVKGERFNSLIIDSKNRVWAGGDLGGLNLYNKEYDAFDRIEVGELLNKNISILSLMENKNGEICVGTVASGMFIYNPETKSVKNFTEDSGLLNSVIHAMLEDNSGNFWLSTNNGLSVLNTTSNTFTNYTKTDGLQGNQYNNGSSYKLSNGLILFGGTNGWDAFYPDSIRKSDKVERIIFTNFWVNGKLVSLNDENSILSNHLNSLEPINLKHDQKSFTVEFGMLDYDFSPVNQYAYFLEGFDTEWQDIGIDRKAVFTNLSPNDYKLKVKATNHDGFWIEKPEVLVINIIPAWWQTSYFRISVLMLAAILLYLIYRIRINFLINQSKKLERIVEHRTAELKSKNVDLHEKHNEIQAQNEELSAQNEQINLQREELEKTQSELRDINERLEDIVKKRTTKLETTIKQLDKTVLELDRFVYSASHDLSSPLKSIKGLIQILRFEQEPERINTCINHMIKSVSSLENVIKSLVDYSRNTHMEINKTSVYCYNQVDEVISELKYWPEAKKIRIDNAIDKTFMVNSDANRLKIILHNLIGNSIKYADLTKDNPYIKIDCESVLDGWKLIVSDNGIGIDKKHLKKVFNMYYRASENSKGSGLGLFIAKESVTKLNGNIDVWSEKSSGTTFTISFQN